MTIGRLMEGRSTAVITCRAQDTVEAAVAILADRRIGALPVLDGDEVVGIFSERDVIYQLRKHGPSMLALRVRDVMTAPPVSARRESSVLGALSLMTQRRIRHLPVMEDGRMIGFISIGDLVKYRIERIESEAEALRAYIQTA